jgi:hypothetical protein
MARTVLTADSRPIRYFWESRRFPMLELQEEYVLAKELVRVWRPRLGTLAHDQPFAARGQDRQGLSRLWPADLGRNLSRQT